MLEDTVAYCSATVQETGPQFNLVFPYWCQVGEELCPESGFSQDPLSAAKSEYLIVLFFFFKSTKNTSST